MGWIHAVKSTRVQGRVFLTCGRSDLTSAPPSPLSPENDIDPDEIIDDATGLNIACWRRRQVRQGGVCRVQSRAERHLNFGTSRLMLVTEGIMT